MFKHVQARKRAVDDKDEMNSISWDGTEIIMIVFAEGPNWEQYQGDTVIV
jgi:hypothetical protein